MSRYNHQSTYHSSSSGRSNRSSNSRRMEEDRSYDDPYSPYGSSHSQMQHQLLRSKEASKQMVYGVFGNLIAILEEFERRETGHGHGKSLAKSDIYIPDQRHKGKDDVESIVNTQILLFETQTKACPPEALDELKDGLKRRTLAWAAVREEMGIKGVHKTDTYVMKLYEILAKGRTHHDIPRSHHVSEEVMKDSFPKIMQGIHDQRALDESFKKDPSRKATAPNTRASEMYYEGAQRINRAKANNDLDQDLQRSVRRYQNNVQ